MNCPTFFRKTGKRYSGFLPVLSFDLLLLVSVASCKNQIITEQFRAIEEKKIRPSGIDISYPADGSIFPPEFPAPGFCWNEPDKKSPVRWNLQFSAGDGKVIFTGTAESSTWKPDPEVWAQIKTSGRNNPVFLTIIGENKRGKNSSGRMSFSFSKDSVGASVFYRAVPLPFGYAVRNVHEIEWYRGSIAGGSPHKVLDNIPVCANCHSFSGNGIIAMDVDYANDKGSYIISPIEDTVRMTLDKIITWSDYKREDGAHTYGLLSRISPDGKFVLSTVKDRSVFVALDNLEYSQLFFPVKGIIGVYNRASKKFTALPGASDKAYVQSNPDWSPDNREVMFARTKRYMSPRIDNSESVLLDQEDVKEFTTHKKEFKFDLYSIPFNEGEGGEAIPVPGASGNGKSNFFARYSPDGKWIVFCQSANFMLLQPDSKLYIMPVQGGTPHLMKCNTGNMNSWHSWSPNSRWLVFSSKIRGPYTQLYLTHIDENGNDSPAIFLENMAFEKRAANIPEFFSDKFPQLRNMSDEFSQNALYYNRMASVNINENEFKSALENIAKAIDKDSSWYDAYKNRLYVDLVLGRAKSKADLLDRSVAMRLINNRIQNNPGDQSLVVKRGELKLLIEDFEDALKDGQNALKVNPKDYSAYELIEITYQKKGEPEKAVQYLMKMQEMQPDNTRITFTLANLYKSINQIKRASELLNDLIARNPLEPAYYISRAGLSVKEGDMKAAQADYDKAISADPDNFEAYRERGSFYRHMSSPDKAGKDFDRALSILDEMVRKNPQNARLLINRAEIMEMNGNIKGALNEYENYLKEWPLNYSVLVKLGQIWSSMKQWENSIDSYSTVIDNFPDDAKVFFSRGIAFQQAGMLNEALRDFNNAIRLVPDEYPYFYFRSRIKSQMGDQSGSKNDLKISASLLKQQKTRRRLDKAEEDLLTSIQNLLK